MFSFVHDETSALHLAKSSADGVLTTCTNECLFRLGLTYSPNVFDGNEMGLIHLAFSVCVVGGG